MNRFCLLIGVLLLVGCNAFKHKSTNHLTLIKAYEVITNGDFEPSGLTVWDGVFYTVSDKHNYIYRIDFTQDQARLIPLIFIDNHNQGKFDFEGITHDEENFYLASERYFQVVKVSRDGLKQELLSEEKAIELAGKKAGLFQVNNAYLEGICLSSQQNLLLVAERQPRGIINAQLGSNTLQISQAYASDYSIYPTVKQRTFDFSGLSCSQGKVYMLERNADRVTEYVYRNNRFQQSDSWLFSKVINLPQHQYQDMEYGHAEGLVVEGDDVFIILDNNKSYHTDGNNNNSLFLKMKK